MFEMRKPLGESADEAVWTLPVPEVDRLDRTLLCVLPADNIELREDYENTVGLERQKVPSPSTLEPPACHHYSSGP